MDLKSLYKEIRKEHAEISGKADVLYDKYWNEIVKVEFSIYSWFESLANALNREMQKNIDAVNYKGLFELIHHSFMVGDDEVKKTIDVAFVENLFGQVPSKSSLTYWESLPNILKELYIGFHGKSPLK